MTNRIVWKFFGAFAVLILIVILVLNFFVSLRLSDNFEQKISEELRSSAILVGDILRDDLLDGREKDIQSQTRTLAEKLDLRITVIDKDGKVLGDSEKDPVYMENHIKRREIAQAIQNDFGQSTRPSDTLGYNMKYVAVRLDEPEQVVGFIRLAVPLSKVQLELRTIYRVVLFGAITAVAIALIVAFFLSKSITSPISQMQQTAERFSRGDFSSKIKIKSQDELGQLARSLNTMADELQQKIENLKRMDMVRTDFVANVSHELKTPLTLIKGYIETLEGKSKDDKEESARFISIIKEHSDRLGNIIDDLLSLSELELSKDCVNKTEFDLEQLIDEILLGFGHALDEKKLSLTTNSQGSNFIIKADRDKIGQVLVNIIDNAIKYTKESGRIEVSLSEHNEVVKVSIQDSGIGIPKEHLGRIFERFYRVDKARSRQLGGTGLGLSIAKHIVLVHNGNIIVESELNKGTNVSISFPKS